MPKIIFSTPFTGKTPWQGEYPLKPRKSTGWSDGGGGFKGQDWFERRHKIFRELTLKSLYNQTDKDFLIWLQFRPQEKNNPVTEKIENEIKKSGLKYILTFDGPIMMEDQATWHNFNLIERAERSLKQLEPIDEDYVVEFSLDSDDMIHKKMVELLRSKEMKEHGAFYMRKGFMYSVNGKMADWENPHSMSLYAIVYPTDVFLDATRHFMHQNGLNSHEQIPKLFDAEELPNGMFCCPNHGLNISTVWDHPFRKKEYFYQDEIEQILKDFKIN